MQACCSGGIGEFGVGNICDLRFCGRSSGLLVVGSRKRGPLAAFSDNSERFLCSEAPSLRFLTVVASLLSAFSALPSAGRQRCGFWMSCSRASRPGSLALAPERRCAFERHRAPECCANSAAELIGGLPTARWPGCLTGLRRLGGQAANRLQQSSTLLSRIGLGLLNNQRRLGRGIH